MCLAVTDQGGPRRCSGDARAALRRARAAVEVLEQRQHQILAFQRPLVGCGQIPTFEVTAAAPPYHLWQEINEGGPRIQSVTAEDIQRVTREYLVKENRSVATYTRKAGSKEDPEFAGLTAQQKPFARQFTASIKKETDPAKLTAQLKQINGRLEQGDKKSQQLFKILKRSLETRLKELAKK